jgi:hypothetical protein
LNTFDVSVIKTLGITEKKAFKNPKNKLAVRDINQELKHRKVGHGIRQFTVPNARVDGLNINRSILALADPGHLKVYFGAAVFFGFRTAEVGGQTKVFYEDCTTRDLRMIIDWYMIQRDNPCVSKLTRYPTEIYSEPGQPRLSFVPAVKINCEGDILRLSSLTGQGMDMVEDVWVLNKDQLNNRHAAQLPAMAGLPWLVQPCSCFGSYDHLVDKDNVGILRNWVGRVFMTDAKQPFPASHMTIGPNNTLPENLDATHCGTIIIMHANARHINTLHVAAFYEFVERVFATVPTRFHRDQVDKGSQRVLTETFELEKLIRKDHFERFWLVWAEARIGIVGELCTSPYNDHLAAVAVSAEMGACLEVVSVEEAKEARKEAESLLSEEV